ncbi:MAG: dienelactone hydrolase family protein [Candidatus Lustribacter sp.]
MSTTETTSTLPRFDGKTFDVTINSSGTRGPGVIFICSAYGVNKDLRATLARYAGHGFVCIAPDMFSHCDVPGPLEQLDENRPKARGRLGGYDTEVGLQYIKTAMEALRARPDCSGPVAVAGFCFGGKYAYLSTTRLGAAAALSFHGVGIGEHLDEADKEHAPMSLHFGADDPLTPPDEVAAIEAAFKGRPDVGVYSYLGAKHGFAQADSAAYDPAVAKTSEERALATLATLR